MRKIISILLAISVICCGFSYPVRAISLDASQLISDLGLGSQEYLLIDTTHNEVVMSKDADKVVKVASLSKIMTALVIMENRKLDENVTITQPMLSGLYDYIVIGLSVGQKVSVEDLLYALMLYSAGDAAQALAISTSGSIAGFADLMNKRVADLDLKNTHFSNPTGMDYDNYSTASDMAVILQEALKNPTFVKIFEAHEWQMTSINKKVSGAYKKRAHIKGGKTGYTGQAGRCLASTATIDEVDYLLINLGAGAKTSDHLDDAEKIYTYIDEKYDIQTIIKKDVLAQTLQVKDSFRETVDLYTEDEISGLFPADIDHTKIEYIYEGMTVITRDVAVDTKVGQYVAKYNGEELGRVNLYLRDRIFFLDYPTIAGFVAGGAVIALIIACVVRALIRRH